MIEYAVDHIDRIAIGYPTATAYSIAEQLCEKFGVSQLRACRIAVVAIRRKRIELAAKENRWQETAVW